MPFATYIVKLAAKFTAWCVGLLLLLLMGILAALWPRPAGSELSIQFVSRIHMNEPGYVPCVVFGVTNLSSKSLTWVWAYPQVRSNKVWSEIEIQPQNQHEDLDAGEGMHVHVPVPRRGDAWRLPIVWSFVPTKLQAPVADFINSRREAQKGAVPGWTSRFGLACCTNFSAEMALTQAEPQH